MKRLHNINKVLLAVLLTAVSGNVFGQDPPKIRIMGNVYGGGQQAAVAGNTNVTLNNDDISIANSDTNDKDGAGTPDDRGYIYGGGAMADVGGNTNITINGGSIDGGIFGGGEGKNKADGAVDKAANVAGNTNVTILGGELHPKWNSAAQRFYYNCNIYGGGNVASTIEGNTYVTMNKGMLSNTSDGTTNFLEVGTSTGFDLVYDAIGIPQLCLFGAGLGKNTNVAGNTFVDYNINFTGNKTVAEINGSVTNILTGENYDNQILIDVIGGGFNGTVTGETNVHVGGNSMCRNVYGGGFYNTVGGTNVLVTSGNIDNVYGGGVIGSVMNATNTAATNVQIGIPSTGITFNGNPITNTGNKKDIAILNSVYGANDVSGTVNQANVTINGGKILRNVYGAGNGEYEGYDEPGEHVAFDMGESAGNYTDVTANATGDTKVYNGRPVTNNVAITLGGQANDRAEVLGQVFGGGNSCTITDNGNLAVTLASHVSIGQKTSVLQGIAGTEYMKDGENVSGLFMGSSGATLAEQPAVDDTDNQFYHRYYDTETSSYKLGFEKENQTQFDNYVKNILVKSDHVSLTVANDAEDIWLANFVGGGFRGSMQAYSSSGHFCYRLSRGVTVANAVIGGAYNADVSFDGGSGTSYTFNGGMLAETGSTTRINLIQTNYLAQAGSESNKDFTGTGASDDASYNYYKNDALVRLDLNNKFEPEKININPSDPTIYNVHGGNVFGGCFASGRVQGDVWTDYRCYQEGDQSRSEDFNLSDRNFSQAKDFENNFAMMLFGAGYGEKTTIEGSAYVRVLHQEANPSATIPGMAYGYPRLYNVFGGSYEGKVNGNTNIYFNPGKYGYVAGAIYGGGCNGYVGGRTYLELAGGYIDEAYGGARNANIGGGTHVWAYDGSARWWGEDVVHANGSAFIEMEAEKAPLFIGTLYGGTDISGKICTDEGGNYTSTNGYQPYYTAEYWANELTTDGVYNSSDRSNQKYVDTYLQVGGIHQSNNGYPIIGSIYAAGNGENTKRFFDAKYAVTGDAVDQYDASKLPDQHSTLLEVSDGNIIYAFGGGNRATVTDQNYILVRSYLDSKHDVEGLGGTMYEVMKKRVLSVGVDCYDEKTVSGQNVLSLKNSSIQRLFGGNNIATMAIQPKWSLQSGRINNVYSGGNMGDMTYYNPSGLAATSDGCPGSNAGRENNTDGSNSNYSPVGLSITIEHPEIHIGSLFGGCRISDVIPGGYLADGKTPAQKSLFDSCEDYYGATVNITDGYIENVYGGNDISGKVYFGTNVNISGAVSGNVYGSGNGFYLYKWDTQDDQITEHLLTDFDSNASNMELCYTVPVKSGLNDTQKLLAINAARPSVEKAFLNIAGLENYTDPETHTTGKRIAYVKGNVYCGGNASTITGDGSFSKFKIGSYVTLNGVFMGSDGYAYTQQDEIAKFAKVNGFTDMGAPTVAAAFPDYNGTTSDDQSHNPILLNVYMMAVDMKAHPKDFNLNLPLTEAHIGTYCGGGNRGSMLVEKMVELPFHHDIIIYDKIVGACLDANISYNQNGTIIKSIGGYSRAVDVENNGTNGNAKIKLEIASQFVPMVMDVPADKLPTTKNSHGENFAQAAAHDFLYDNRTGGVKYTFQEFNELFRPTTLYEDQATFEATEGANHLWKTAPGLYAPSCNIYGGCYQSGEVEGDIIINLHSNMLRYVNKDYLDRTNEENIACFNVYGAGFGQDSHVWGNVNIVMDRSLDAATMGSTIAKSTLSSSLNRMLSQVGAFDILEGKLNSDALSVTHDIDRSYPSFNNIFGGGRNGKLIGNSTVEIRNGYVYNDVAGGCYASDMYGSTQVIIGYPVYYKAKISDEYKLDRADKWNENREDYYGNKVIKKSVKYLKGDIVPENVYKQIVAKTPGNASNFEKQVITPATYHSTDGTTWNDIHIKIGKGVYGGGYSLANSAAVSAGNITTNKLIDDGATTTDLYPHNFDRRLSDFGGITTTAGYGGNSSIMVGDMDHSLAENSSYNERDHIRISTLKATPVTIPATSTVIGKFIKEPDGRYTHQGDGAPTGDKQYYDLSGDGGIYGDGHLTFCEGFRTADVSRYGWADGTPKHPILMNTFQRMDLLSVNDCCLMLQGAQDFATDQIDATVYSITRINELRMNSSIDHNETLGQISAITGAGDGPTFDYGKQRNYLAFFNNVHYLGAIVTDDSFDDSFHSKEGNKDSLSYKGKKEEFITTYKNSGYDTGGKRTAAATTEFKKRNVGTARNAIGINNGYCLRIQNQEYVDNAGKKEYKTYYGPIVGVCEVKLLTLTQGEGGGYVYADNIHANPDDFLMTSGNFVFPGIIEQGTDSEDKPIGDQYIVDDCFLDHFGSAGDITTKVGELDEAHYWYVEGNRYFFTTTLTGFTYKSDPANPMVFDLIKTDPNVILSGLQEGSTLHVKKIEWLSEHRVDYDSDIWKPETPNRDDDYEFDIQVGGSSLSDWHYDLPRGNSNTIDNNGTLNDHLPQLNIHLQDKIDNSGEDKYINHLDEPEVVKIYLEGTTQDDAGTMSYEYTITLNIVYLLGPTFEGGVKIENCALPGEWIGFSSDGLKVKTPELMPITAASWRIVPLKEIDEHGVWHWDIDQGIVIPSSDYSENPETQNIEGHIPALYKQNEYNIAYVFTAGGYDFPVMPVQSITYKNADAYNEAMGTTLTTSEFDALTDAQKVSVPKKEERMIVVHNYHRMKDVVARNLQIETMPRVENKTVNNTDPDPIVYHPQPAEAKLYIEDEEDLIAFVNYLNMATTDNLRKIPEGLTGLDIILQKDVTLTSALPAISVPFAGTFHGDGYNINLAGKQTSLFGSNLTGKVYNLGLIGRTEPNADPATIASTMTNVINSYVYEVEFASDENAVKYGRKAYQLSHAFNPTTDHDDHADYVANRYANGDYQYATTDRVWSLRTGAPNYGTVPTRHNTVHTHDIVRWVDDDGVTTTDILSEKGSNVPLYDGTAVIADEQRTVANSTVTYHGLPAGYANDYLFFGQHLDKTNADAYPVHIEPVANGDANYAKGGNRVYETDAYYQSKTPSKMYYNKDAWALQPTLTAIDYTSMTAEGDTDLDGDGTPDGVLPATFSVDSNKDYGTYSNATDGHVSQNLLVYNAGESVFDKKDEENIAEQGVVYHNIVKSGSPATFSTDYFHLVDKQDFNAPIAFNVNTRAWYERLPEYYRNLVDNDYQSSSAWEGIVLPFTATKVTAEKNGEISHFYGKIPTDEGVVNDRTLHHEYWLTGMVAADGDKATFARPAVSGDGLFVEDNQTKAKRNYTYQANSYFTSLFNYNGNYDTRDDEGDDTMGNHDKAWYAKEHTFTDYVPLTAEVPYIVAFPGDDFYEFSMESYYYDQSHDSYGHETYLQKATFESIKPVDASFAASIGISDNSNMKTTVGTHTHTGTYLHQTGKMGINATGTAFEANQPILPFRTYMTVSASPAPIRTIIISDGYSSLSDEENEDPHEEMVGAEELRIWGDGLEIVVETACVRTLNVYASDGSLREVLHCQPGVNRFAMKNGGLYMVGRVKLLLK